MTTMQISMLIGASAAAWAALCYLDFKYQFRFVDWLNGTCQNPFQKLKIESNEKLSPKDREIAQLKERIQVLEKIVTEPAYELDKKLNSL